MRAHAASQRHNRAACCCRECGRWCVQDSGCRSPQALDIQAHSMALLVASPRLPHRLCDELPSGFGIFRDVQVFASERLQTARWRTVALAGRNCCVAASAFLHLLRPAPHGLGHRTYAWKSASHDARISSGLISRHFLERSASLCSLSRRRSERRCSSCSFRQARTQGHSDSA